MDDFQKKGSEATPYFILTLFDELLFQKELVLIRGDVVNFKITKEEAKDLMLQTLNNFTQMALYEKYILPFNHNQAAFDFQDFAQYYQLPQA